MSKSLLGKLIDELASINIQIWHEEDKTRSPDDHQVAEAKRKIDKLNQRRNDLIEKIDESLSYLLYVYGNNRKFN